MKLLKGIINGEREALSKAITLIESNLEKDKLQSEILIKEISNKSNQTNQALRIGITGVPGVGKSTFIESFGKLLLKMDKKVAVLAIDPTSTTNNGSILGDKSRMHQLSKEKNAFIRPSPTSGTLGGVAEATNSTIKICEAAGYNIILIETVGVGQSETIVASMVDLFLLLMLPNAGDELQGIKKGVLELADLVVINKSDGKQETLAKTAQSEYRKALHLLPSSKNSWTTQILRCSALEKRGMDKIWDSVKSFSKALQNSGEWEKQRRKQTGKWMWSLVEEGLLTNFRNHPDLQKQIPVLEKDVESGKMLPTTAARKLLDSWYVG